MSETAEDLQNALNILKSYCDHWKLTVNVNKTMIFRKGGSVTGDLGLKYGGNELEVVTKFSYLGVTFSSYEDLSIKHSKRYMDKLLKQFLN